MSLFCRRDSSIGTTNPGTGLNFGFMGVRISPSFPPIACPMNPDQDSGPVVLPSVKETFIEKSIGRGHFGTD